MHALMIWKEEFGCFRITNISVYMSSSLKRRLKSFIFIRIGTIMIINIKFSSNKTWEYEKVFITRCLFTRLVIVSSYFFFCKVELNTTVLLLKYRNEIKLCWEWSTVLRERERVSTFFFINARLYAGNINTKFTMGFAMRNVTCFSYSIDLCINNNTKKTMLPERTGIK